MLYQRIYLLSRSLKSKVWTWAKDKVIRKIIFLYQTQNLNLLLHLQDRLRRIFKEGKFRYNFFTFQYKWICGIKNNKSSFSGTLFKPSTWNFQTPKVNVDWYKSESELENRQMKHGRWYLLIGKVWLWWRGLTPADCW